MTEKIEQIREVIKELREMESTGLNSTLNHWLVERTENRHPAQINFIQKLIEEIKRTFDDVLSNAERDIHAFDCEYKDLLKDLGIHERELL